jgi:hypothetical protein
MEGVLTVDRYSSGREDRVDHVVRIYRVNRHPPVPARRFLVR